MSTYNFAHPLQKNIDRPLFPIHENLLEIREDLENVISFGICNKLHEISKKILHIEVIYRHRLMYYICIIFCYESSKIFFNMT